MIDGIDIGKALEQDRLAFHHRLGCQRSAIAEPENGGAIGDDGNEITFGGVVEGAWLSSSAMARTGTATPGE